MRLVLRLLVLLGAIVAAVAAARATTSSPQPSRLTRSPGTAPALAAHTSPAASQARAAPAANPIFGTPVQISTASTTAAEPSIKVDRTDADERIWVTAPAGIGARTQLGSAGGDLVWYSDDDGQTWTGQNNATIVGGGDSDVAPGYDGSVFVTGLTLANVTVSGSCDNGGTFHPNPVSTAGTVEDRQWLDAYVDHPKPTGVGAPDVLLDIGLSQLVGAQENPRVVLYQMQAPQPACTPPTGGPPLDTALPSCPLAPPATLPDCYQWPGNLAIDEASGDVYVTYNTQGNDGGGAANSDKVVVARVDGAGERVSMQSDVHPVEAASGRPDTFDSFTSVAVDGAGNVYVVWSERHPGPGETASMFAYSTDHGVTWSPPVQVNAAPKTTTFPWIVAWGDGKVDVVYYGTPTTGASPEVLGPSTQWKVYLAQSLNAHAAAPTFTEVEATPVMHQGSICTSGTGCASGTRNLLDYFQVDVDSDDLANIAYTNDFNTPSGDPYVTFVQQLAGGPTLAVVRSFAARRLTRGVELRWQTSSDAGLLGFDVFRGTARLNAALVRATGRTKGAAYRFVDRAGRPGAAYRLRLQWANGTRGWAGAARVRVR